MPHPRVYAHAYERTQIQALPSPKNVTELQQFLGIVQYMSPFIPRLAHTAPLRAMTKKDSKFEWNDSLKQAFERVKSMICEDMSLSYFDVTKPTVIQVRSTQPFFLARRLKPASVRQYLNIIRILHLECNLANPCVDSWLLKTTLKGIEKVKRTEVMCKQPVTPTFLLKIKSFGRRVLSCSLASYVSQICSARTAKVFARINISRENVSALQTTANQ